MFIGHFGIAMGSKKIIPKVSLGLLFLAAQLLDLLWPSFLLTHLERVEINSASGNLTPLNFTHYPYSHSLVMVLGWAIVFGLLYWFVTKRKMDSVVLGVLVLSHWILDVIVHVPDLPLYPGDSPMLGFGVWKSLILTLVIEGTIFVAGIVMYLKATKAKNRIGSIGFWLMIVLLTAVYTWNFAGSPPPDVNTIAWAGQLQWIFVVLAFWIDKNRQAKGFA